MKDVDPMMVKNCNLFLVEKKMYGTYTPKSKRRPLAFKYHLITKLLLTLPVFLLLSLLLCHIGAAGIEKGQFGTEELLMHTQPHDNEELAFSTLNNEHKDNESARIVPKSTDIRAQFFSNKSPTNDDDDDGDFHPNLTVPRGSDHPPTYETNYVKPKVKIKHRFQGSKVPQWNNGHHHHLHDDDDENEVQDQDEEDSLKTTVPVVPIELPPPNSTTNYHYTDDDDLFHIRLNLKTDFSRIVLPFKGSREELNSIRNYRDVRFGDDFDLYKSRVPTKDALLSNYYYEGDDRNPLQLSTRIGQLFKNNVKDKKTIGGDNHQKQQHYYTNASSSSAAIPTVKKNRKTSQSHLQSPRKKIKGNGSKTKKDFEIMPFEENEKNNKKVKLKQRPPPQLGERFRQNDFSRGDHDYPQISHDLMLHKKATKLKNQQRINPKKSISKRGDNYEDYNNNAIEDNPKIRRSKSDNTIVSSSSSRDVFAKHKNIKTNAISRQEELFLKRHLEEDDDYEDEHDVPNYDNFEFHKISNPSVDNVTAIMVPGNNVGTSLEDISLSLDYNNGEGKLTGRKRGQVETDNNELIRRRPRRSVVHLYDMVVCATGCNPLAYKGYGCYCGFLGSGLTVDGIDRCCAKHDWCYHHAKCPPFLTYFVPYYWTCNDGRPRCVTEYRGWKGVCGANLCECDRQFAECLRKYECPRHRRTCLSSPWRFWQNLIMLPTYHSVTFRRHRF